MDPVAILDRSPQIPWLLFLQWRSLCSDAMGNERSVPAAQICERGSESLVPQLLILPQNERRRLRTVQNSTQGSVKRDFCAHRNGIPVSRGR